MASSLGSRKHDHRKEEWSNAQQIRSVPSEELEQEAIKKQASPFWDNSPKLLQVLEYLFEPENNWISIREDKKLNDKLNEWLNTLGKSGSRYYK